MPVALRTLLTATAAASDPGRRIRLSNLFGTRPLTVGAVSTIHGFGLQTAYLKASGDATGAADFPSSATDDNRYFLSDVEVLGPDALAARLQADPALATIGIANGGIAGNRVMAQQVDLRLLNR